MKRLAAVVFSTCLLWAGSAQAQENEFNAKPTCNVATPQCFYQHRIYELERKVRGCRESRKVEGSTTYTVCRLKGKPVKAAEFLTQFGDGLGYWFENGQVVAIQRFHDGSMIFFEKGKVVELYEDGGAVSQNQFSATERTQLERMAKNGFRGIFQKLKVR